MFNGHAHGIEEYEHDDEPIEPLGLDGVSYPKTESFFGTPKVLTAALRFHF